MTTIKVRIFASQLCCAWIVIVGSVFCSSSFAQMSEAEAALQLLIGEPEDPNCDCLKKTATSNRRSSLMLESSVLQRLGKMDENQYQVKFGDTLDAIIKAQLPELPVKKAILRDAIVSANEHAFRRNNPHWMYADRTLKLPDSSDIHQAIFKTSAPDTSSLTRNRKQKDWIRYP
jgi:hypothetical protein